MSKYLLCIIIGIILYLLLNNRNEFSVGGETIKVEMVTNTSGPGECKANEDKGCTLVLSDSKIPTIRGESPEGVQDYCYQDCSPDPWEVFDELDKQGWDDQRLNEDDMIHLMENLGRGIFGRKLLESGEFARIDTDGSGAIKYEEFLAWFESHGLLAHEKECKSYHTYKSCVQNCPLEQVKNDPTKNIRKDGFHKVEKLLELDSQNFEFFRERLNTNNDIEDENLKGNYKGIKLYNGLSFAEYILKRYLELREGGNKFVKKLSNGIFYINGKIVYFKYIDFIITRISEKNNSSGVFIPTEYEGFYRKTQHKSHHLPFLHGDTQNVVRYKVLDKGPDPDPVRYYKDSEQCPLLRNVKGKRMSQAEYLFNDSIFFDDRVQELNMRNGIKKDIEFDDNILFINIWVLFYGTPNVETLGFIDAIDDDRPKLYDDTDGTLVEMMRDTVHPDRLTSAFLTDVVYPNIYNAETNENTGDSNKPNINTTKLYTYDMEAGDALIFRTDGVPHIGFPPSTLDGLRMSLEDRYALLTHDFDLTKVFIITITKASVMTAVSKLPKFDMWGGIEEQLADEAGTTFKIKKEVTLPYKQPEIVQYFSEQFTIFLKVYNNLLNPSQKDKLQLNIELFQRFMDETPYDDYYYRQEEKEKGSVISQFLQKILEEEEDL